MTKIEKWTVVRHSAWAYGRRNPQFKKGLETRSVNTKGQQKLVEAAGGVLFDSYGEAEEFAEKEMYPAGFLGIIPAARGTFARATVDGLQVYVPQGSDVEQMQAAIARVESAAEENSNDDEIQAWHDALDLALTRWPEVAK